MKILTKQSKSFFLYLVKQPSVVYHAADPWLIWLIQNDAKKTKN